MKTGAPKSLVLHIGANKTGSSAIQQFLGANAERLLQHGAVIAPADLMRQGPVTGQHVPFLEHLRQDMPFGRKIVAERIPLLMRDLPEGGQLVMSAENLSNLNGTWQLFSDVVGKYDVRVLLYIRRQDELLLSSWQQWGSKSTSDFWSWIVTAAGKRGNWRLTLEPWEALVGREKIGVRIFDRRKLYGSNIITDFLEFLGVEPGISEFSISSEPSNPSYSAAVVDLVKGNPLLFTDIHDNSVYEIIDTLTGTRFLRPPRESIISHHQRVALLGKYTADNTWVKNCHFPQSIGSLFPDPRPEDYDVVTAEHLESEKWELVATLLQALSTRVEARSEN